VKYAYPIIITKGQHFYVVYIPDFDINTQGETVAEAMEMARDAIGMCGCFKEEKNQDLPAPSSLDKVEHSSADIITLVDVDFDEYRRRNQMRAVRKNVTIPSWLNEEAERAGLNFSAVLQSALKAELKIN
jgi:predicted RNase H-like HicB family nuclease